jgi:hypothetical protein
MALDHLEDVNKQVNSSLESQAPTLTAQVVEAATTTPAADEVARLRAENEELKRAAITAKTEADDKQSDLRLKVAKAIAHKPVPVVRSNVQQDLAFAKLRDTLGGNCFVKNLTPVEQLEGIGIVGSEQIKDAEVKRFFGKGSDAGAANALHRSDPARYSLLRAAAKARGLY